VIASLEFERRLERFINETLLGGAGEPPVRADTLLFEEGHLNSLRILDLIAFVEKTLDRKIPDRAVKLGNFRSIRVIARTFHPDTEDNGDAAEREPAPERIFERRTDPARFASPVDALCARGELTLPAPGRVGLSGAVLGLFQYFDAVALGWARELGAREHEYPNLIALATLERAGHLGSFPHQLTLVSHLEREPDLLRRVAAEPGSLRRDDLAAPRHALAPAVCYHCYPEWAGRTLDAGPVVLTARGRCARVETGHPAPLERQWDFAMREIIVLGSRDEVEAARRLLVRRASELMDALDLDGCIETAHDPFFTRASRGKRLLQQLGTLKYELRLRLDGGGRSLAVASFNHHQDHFGRCFEIRRPGGAPAHSGCVALGLERWVLGFLTQRGVNESAWPGEVRSWCEARRACDATA
jgi:acyl carrier protein